MALSVAALQKDVGCIKDVLAQLQVSIESLNRERTSSFENGQSYDVIDLGISVINERDQVLVVTHEESIEETYFNVKNKTAKRWNLLETIRKARETHPFKGKKDKLQFAAAVEVVLASYPMLQAYRSRLETMMQKSNQSVKDRKKKKDENRQVNSDTHDEATDANDDNRRQHGEEISSTTHQAPLSSPAKSATPSTNNNIIFSPARSTSPASHVHNTPLSSPVKSTQPSSRVHSTPTSSPVHSTPHSPTAHSTLTSSPSHSTPPSPSAHITPPSSPAHSTSPSSPAHSTPPSSPAHSTPPSSPAHSTPPSSPAHSTPPSSPAHSTPPLSPAHSTPPSSPAHSTPPSSPAHSTPPSSPAHSTPPSSPAHSTSRSLPVYSTQPLSPSHSTSHSSLFHRTPHSSPAHNTPPSSPAHSTPTSSPTKITPHSSPLHSTPPSSPVRRAFTPLTSPIPIFLYSPAGHASPVQERPHFSQTNNTPTTIPRAITLRSPPSSADKSPLFTNTQSDSESVTPNNSYMLRIEATPTSSDICFNSSTSNSDSVNIGDQVCLYKDTTMVLLGKVLAVGSEEPVNEDNEGYAEIQVLCHRPGCVEFLENVIPGQSKELDDYVPIVRLYTHLLTKVSRDMKTLPEEPPQATVLTEVNNDIGKKENKRKSKFMNYTRSTRLRRKLNFPTSDTVLKAWDGSSIMNGDIVVTYWGGEYGFLKGVVVETRALVDMKESEVRVLSEDPFKKTYLNVNDILWTKIENIISSRRCVVKNNKIILKQEQERHFKNVLQKYKKDLTIE